MRRTFRNDSQSPYHFTDQHIEILPGEVGTVEMPREQPAPHGLTEVRRSGADIDDTPAPERPTARRRVKRRETVTEPAPAPENATEES